MVFGNKSRKYYHDHKLIFIGLLNLKSANNTTPEISVLLYHQIGETVYSHSNLDCLCLVGNFYEQMKYLKNNNYRVIGLNEALSSLHGHNTLDGPTVVLTFDDGDISFLELALPILQEFKFHSVVFAVSGFLGQHAHWIKEPKNRMRIMSAVQLQSLAMHLVEIGSHSVTHSKLTQLNEKEIRQELYNSKSYLEDIIGNEVASFAYPHGCYNDTVLKTIMTVGYRCAVTCKPDQANNAPSFFEIPRKYITYQDNIEELSKKLSSN